MIPQIKEIEGKFPEYATLSQATVTLNDMGDMTISSQVKILGSIVPDFSYDWEVEFKGAKYIHPIREPQASKDNTSICSVIDLVFQHWAIYQLKRYYFVQLATTESGTAVVDKYNASLGLSLPYFCVELQRVLDFYFPDKFVIDFNDQAEYDSESKFISISYSYIWEVLQKVYETYNVRWDIQPLDVENDRYTIRIGYEAEDIDHIFEYGFEGGLLKVERQVQNSEIRNKLLGRGGSKNLPYLYFKDNEKYGETKDNNGFTPDPDAIPELKKIYFTELRCANFRSYVQGWKTNPNRDLSYGDVVEEYDEARAIDDFAYKAGHEDTKFNPIEYVKDDESIAKYGVLEGALENNEETYPSIQGAMTKEYGRADEVVDVEEVTTDYGESESDVKESKVLEVIQTTSITNLGYAPNGEISEKTFKIVSNWFEIPEGYKGFILEKSSSAFAKLTRESYKLISNVTPQFISVISSDIETEIVDFQIRNYEDNTLLNNSVNIPSGKYRLETTIKTKKVGFPFQDGELVDGYYQTNYYFRYIINQISATLSANVNLYDVSIVAVDNAGSNGLPLSATSTIEGNSNGEIVVLGDTFEIPEEGALNADVPIDIYPRESVKGFKNVIEYINLESGEIIDRGIIPQGKWQLRVTTTIENGSAQAVSFTVQLQPAMFYLNKLTDTWRPTFNIWLKNIWEDTQEDGESDEAYANRVWTPILGQVEGETAKVTFLSGLLSMSSDWDFEIVLLPVTDRTKKIATTDGDVKSEWRLTLAKSDAELESMNKYIPYKDFNAVKGDKFILTGIQIPHEYVLWGEERLRDVKTDALGESSNIKPTWVVQNDKVRLQQDINGQKLIDQIGVGKGFTLKDKRLCANGEKLYIQTLTYNYSTTLPEIEITLAEKPITQVSTIGRIQGEIDSLTTKVGLIGNVEQTVRAIGNRLYLRRDGVDATSDSPTEFRRRISSNGFRQGAVGGSGWALYRDADGRAVVEADKIIARQDLQVNNLVANQITAVGGKEILSAASITVSNVVQSIDEEDGIMLFQCFFDQRQGSVANLFQSGDIAMGQTFSASNEETKFYKMVIVDAGDDYITLSKRDSVGEGVPQVGDVIVQYGNVSDQSRQYVIIRDVIGGGYTRMLRGLDEPRAEGVEYFFAGMDSMNETARWFVGDSSQFVKFEDGKIQIECKQVGMTSEGEDDKTIRIWAGADNTDKENAPFRVLQDGTLIANEANIKGVVNADSGTFRNGIFDNVTIKGSISSPFKQYEGTIIGVRDIANSENWVFHRDYSKDATDSNGNNGTAWINNIGDVIYTLNFDFDNFYILNDNVFVQTNNWEILSISNAINGVDGIGKNDNVAIAISSGDKRTFAPDELSWGVENSGRIVRIVNSYYNNITTTGWCVLYAPQDKYFIEDGERYNTIRLSNQVLELIGFGTTTEFYGWIVLNRKDVNTNKSYGSFTPVLYQGVIRNNTIPKLWTPILQHSFDIDQITLYYYPDTSRVSLPILNYRGLDDIDNWEVICSGAVVVEKWSDDNDNTINFIVEKIGNAENIVFQVLSTADWIGPLKTN